jgi:hypothetical protein
MSDLFRMGPSLLGQVGMAGTSSHVIRPSAQRGTRDRAEEYGGMTPLCDPNVDPNCARMSGSGTHPFGWREGLDEGGVYCDPAVDPNCPLPLVSLEGDPSRSFQANETGRQSPPTEKCNPAWDPACPRPLPQMTVVPYVPSSYLQGPEIVYSRSDVRPRPRDRSGRVY